MSVYKPFKREHYTVTPIEINQAVTVDSSSHGVFSKSFSSGSVKPNGVTPTESGSYWQSLRMNFYLSGSDLAMRNNSGIYPEPNKYSNRAFSLAPQQLEKDYYLSKFNNDGIIPHLQQLKLKMIHLVICIHPMQLFLLVVKHQYLLQKII